MLSRKFLPDRAKSIEAEADALVEAHGAHAREASHHMERQANDLGAALFWRSVKRALSRRQIAKETDILPPARAHNCLTCLAERFSGTHESGAPALPAACLSCVAQRLSGGSRRRITDAREPQVLLAGAPAQHDGSLPNHERQAASAQPEELRVLQPKGRL